LRLSFQHGASSCWPPSVRFILWSRRDPPIFLSGVIFYDLSSTASSSSRKDKGITPRSLCSLVTRE
jgi:hypothetical protein